MFAALDPNWFYSTLAQSTAAIVGLGAAFLVQRMLQQRNEVATPRFDLQHNLQSEFEKVASARRAMYQVANSLAAAADEGRVRQQAGFNDYRVTHDTHAYRWPAGVLGVGNGIPVDLDFRYIAIFSDAAKAANDFRNALPADFTAYVRMLEKEGSLVAGRAEWLYKAPAPIPESTAPYPLLDDAAHQRDHLRHYWREIYKGSEERGSQLRRFRARLVPESFRWLLRIMVALLIVGTILPMLYLSARSEGSRILLLLPFAALALAFFWFIGAEMRQLRKAGDLTRDTF